MKNSDDCTTTIDVTINTPPGAPAAPIVAIVDPTCTVPTGSFTVTSPTAGLTFSLDGGAFAPYPAAGYSGLSAGKHTLTVKNSDDCTTTIDVTINTPPGAPAAPTVAITDPTCTVPTGSFTVTSPTAGLTFSLDGGAFAPYPAAGYSGLSAGKHTLTVKNSDDCTTTIDVTINTPPGAPAAPIVAVVDPTCTVPTGSFTVTSPTAGLTFSLDGGAFAPYPAAGYSGLSAGKHTLTVKNSDDCTTTIDVTINTPPGAPVAPTVAITDPTCTVPTGSFTVTSPTAGLTFSLDGGAFAPYPAAGYSGLSAGKHTLTVKNSDDCTTTIDVTISTPPGAPAAPIVAAVDPTCTVPTGSFTVTSPTAGLTFSLDGGAFAPYPAAGYSGLSAGKHTLDVKNSDGCITATTVVIGSAPGSPDVPAVNVTQPSCEVSAGSFVITSPTTGLTFSLDGRAFAPYPATGFSGLTTGNHTLEVKNSDGCANSTTVTIDSAPESPSVIVSSTVHPTCDAPTGTLTVTASKGTPPYSFSIDGGKTFQTSTSFAGLAPGKYTIDGEGCNGCTGEITETIKEIESFSINESLTHVLCKSDKTGSISLTVTGGTNPSYSWSHGASTKDVINLAAGTYSVTITDQNGCKADRSYSIEEPAAPLAVSETHTDPSANGSSDGTITLTPAGGTTPYSVKWDSGQTTLQLTGLAKGTYKATITDAHQCTVSITVTLSDPEAIITLLCPPDLNSCTGVATPAVFKTYAEFEAAGGKATSNCGKGGINPASFVWISDISDKKSCPETIIRTYSISDFCGKTATCTHLIVMDDNEAPVMNCLGDITLEIGTAIPAAFDTFDKFVAAAGMPADNCSIDRDSYRFSETSVKNLCGEVITRQHIISDFCGNSDTCIIRIITGDNTPPVLKVFPDVTVECAEDAPKGYATLALFRAAGGDATDLNGIDITSFGFTDVVSPGTCPRIITRTYFISDICGNKTSIAQKITIHDNIKPSLTCPADVSAKCLGDAPPAFTMQQMINAKLLSDNCAIDSFSVSEILDRTSQYIKVERNYFASDLCGNVSVCVQRIELSDLEPPKVSCKPVTLYVNAKGEHIFTGMEILASASDNCTPRDKLKLEVSPALMTCAEVGTPQVATLTVTDEAGNSASCTAIVTVLDNIPPSVLCKDVTLYLNSSGTGTITVADVNRGSSDNCGIDKLFIDRTSFDCNDIGKPNLVTLTAVDYSGNQSKCVAKVTVADNLKPSVTCKDVTIQMGADGIIRLNPVVVHASSYDNCGVPSLKLSKEFFTCVDVGVNLVTLFATDRFGNMDSCRARVTILGNNAPRS